MKKIFTFLFITSSFFSSAQTLDNDFANGGTKEWSYQGINSTHVISSAIDNIDKSIYSIHAFPENGIKKVLITKMNSKGNVIQSFGDNGYLKLDKGNNNFFPQEIYIDSNNAIFIYGFYEDINKNRIWYITKIDSNGVIDSSFGTGGYIDNIPLTNIKLLHYNGNYYIYGNRLGQMTLMKYDSKFTLVNSFGNNGVLSLVKTGRYDDIATNFAIQDNYIYILSTIDDLPDNEEMNYNHYLKIAKLNLDGTFVNNFADKGIFIYKDDGIDIDGERLIVDQNNIYIGGSYLDMKNDNNLSQYLILKTDLNGKIDTQFGVNGLALEYSNYNNIGKSFIKTENNQLIIAGYSSAINSKTNIGLTMFNANGEINKAFGNNGLYRYPNTDVVSSTTNISFLENSKILVNGYLNGKGVNVMLSVESKLNTFDLSKKTSNIYPNPVINNLYISDVRNQAITIYNTVGQIVKEGRLTSNGVDVSNLKSGLYYIKFIKDGEIIYSKFIKK